MRSSPARLPASGPGLRVAVDPGRPGGSGGGGERPAGDRAEVRAAGRARGERSSGGRPRATGRRRRAPGAASGAGPPGLPQPRAGPPWTPPSRRAGPAVQAARSVRLGSDW